MSCVGFFTPEQLRRVREAALDPRPVSTFRSPDASEAKVERTRAMAVSADPRIRESAALSSLVPESVLAELAADPQRSVRCCVARNARCPSEVLARLAADDDAGVRGWVAANPAVSKQLLGQLATDEDQTVRAVVDWAVAWQQPSDERVVG